MTYLVRDNEAKHAIDYCAAHGAKGSCMFHCTVCANHQQIAYTLLTGPLCPPTPPTPPYPLPPNLLSPHPKSAAWSCIT